MFDFFKDAYLEAHGVDIDVARKERKERWEREGGKESFPGRTKAIIITMGITFLIMQASQVVALLDEGVGSLVWAAAMCALDLTIIILVLRKGRKVKVVAAILITVFIVLECACTLLMA